MKQIVFAINAKHSYYRHVSFPEVKPNTKLPVVISLDEGGTITLIVDENKNTCTGFGTDIHFTGDQFVQNLSYSITGNLQSFDVIVRNLSMNIDPKNGQIPNGTGSLSLLGMPHPGGAGGEWADVQGGSAIHDANSPAFDLSNGVGPGGGLQLNLRLGGNPDNPPRGFELHIEATAVMEDINGDGKYEAVYRLGVPIQLPREGTVHVKLLFGVTGSGHIVGVLPDGRIIDLSPPEPVLKPMAEGVAELIRGLAVRDLVVSSTATALSGEISQLGLKMAMHGLEAALRGLKEKD